MAFFGLTALGPQNAFAANTLNHRYLQIFEEEDFVQAWRKVNKDRTFCAKNKVEEMLEALFRGPVPKYDLEPVVDAFYDVDDGSGMIALATYVKIMLRLAKEAERVETALEGKPRPECEFNSSQAFKESLRKNAAIKIDHQNKLAIPLTSTQEVSVLSVQCNIIMLSLVIFAFSTDGSVSDLNLLSLAVAAVTLRNLLAS